MKESKEMKPDETQENNTDRVNQAVENFARMVNSIHRDEEHTTENGPHANTVRYEARRTLDDVLQTARDMVRPVYQEKDITRIIEQNAWDAARAAGTNALKATLALRPVIGKAQNPDQSDVRNAHITLELTALHAMFRTARRTIHDMLEAAGETVRIIPGYHSEEAREIRNIIDHLKTTYPMVLQEAEKRANRVRDHQNSPFNSDRQRIPWTAQRRPELAIQ